jgi:hypothetical protein
LSQRKKEITEDQRLFIAECYKSDSKINGAEVRRLYKLRYPHAEDMFGKKVQNLL